MRYVNHSTALLVALGATLTPVAAEAHPHVWIEARSDLVFDDRGLIVAVNHEWKMDEFYSEAAVEGLDTDGNGDYSAAELEPLTRENIESLKEYHYFTEMVDGDKPVDFGDIVETGQLWTSGRLTLHFQMRLKHPVDPAKRRVYYRVYDPSFYISIEFAAKDAIAALGGKPEGCRVELKETVVTDATEETKAMLATKGTDWQPPPEENFGAMFAQPIVVTCE